MPKEKITGTCDLDFSIEREYIEERTKKTEAWITRQLKLALKNGNIKVGNFNLMEWESKPEKEPKEESESPD